MLVPVTPFADRILATTAVPRDKFVFQMANDDLCSLGDEGITAEDRRGDVTLTLRDPSTGREDVLQLRVKLSDFGMAQPLEIDESHLSIKGVGGTILYMAPETLRPTKLDGTKKVSKLVDIWALGVILFQMLHENRTPFRDYHLADGYIGVAVAASNKETHREVMVFERAQVWAVERKKVLLQVSRKMAAESGGTGNGARKNEVFARALLQVWMQTQFLFRMCELCLAFEAADRTVAEDLVRWIGIGFEKDWCKDEVFATEERSFMKLVNVRQNVVLNMVGGLIAEAALPEVFRRDVPNSPSVEDDERDAEEQDRAAPAVPAIPLPALQQEDAVDVDLDRSVSRSGRRAAALSHQDDTDDGRNAKEDTTTPTVPATPLPPGQQEDDPQDHAVEVDLERGESFGRSGGRSAARSPQGADFDEEDATPTEEENATPTVVPATAPLPPLQQGVAVEVDLERGVCRSGGRSASHQDAGPFGEESDARKSFRRKTLGIIVLVVLAIAGLSGLCVGILSARKAGHPSEPPETVVVTDPEPERPPNEPVKDSPPVPGFLAQPTTPMKDSPPTPGEAQTPPQVASSSRPSSASSGAPRQEVASSPPSRPSSASSGAPRQEVASSPPSRPSSASPRAPRQKVASSPPSRPSSASPEAPASSEGGIFRHPARHRIVLPHRPASGSASDRPPASSGIVRKFKSRITAEVA